MIKKMVPFKSDYMKWTSAYLRIRYLRDSLCSPVHFGLRFLASSFLPFLPMFPKNQQGFVEGTNVLSPVCFQQPFEAERVYVHRLSSHSGELRGWDWVSQTLPVAVLF